MNVEDQLLEFEASSLSEDALDRLLLLWEQTKTGNQEGAYVKTALLIGKYHEDAACYDQAIVILKQALASGIINDPKFVIQVTDRLVSILLKLEDFPELKQVLDFRGDYLEESRQARLMQKFYLAVCYEGMRENQRAITCLTEIEDTLSNSNLVSKYLKLAMLYLREGKLPEAKHNYDYATRFDPSRKNPIFHLVASDIHYYEEDYPQAMICFQDYFLATKVRNRYLDRFILICLKTGNFEEARKYYREYLPHVDSLVSKHAKQTFYEAGEKLALALRDHAELAALREKLTHLQGRILPELDQYGSFLEIIRKLGALNRYSGRREVLLHVYRALGDSLTCDRLAFVFLTGVGFRVFTYAKGLLLEKEYNQAEAAGTLIDRIMGEDDEEIVYDSEALATIRDYRDREAFLTSAYALAARTHQELYPKGFVVCLLADKDAFGFTRRIVKLAALIISQKLNEHEQREAITAQTETLKRGLEVLGKALATIENGNVWLRNERAKEIFGFKEDVMPFESLQVQIKTEKRLYLDDFLKARQLTFPYLTPAGLSRHLKCDLWTAEMAIHILAEDITQELQSRAKEMALLDKTDIYGNKSFSRHERDYQGLQTNHAYLVVAYAEADRLFSTYRLPQIAALGTRLIQEARQSAKGYFHQAYTLSLSAFVLVLKTTDKRILERIANAIRQGVANAELVSLRVELGSGAYLNTKRQDFAELERLVLQLAHSGQLATQGIFYAKREQLLHTELTQSVGIANRALLTAGDIRLEYQPVVNWKNGNIAFLEVRSAIAQTFVDERTLKEALIRNNQLYAFHTETLKALGKDIKKAGQSLKRQFTYAYRLSAAELENDKMLACVITELKRQRIAAKQVILVLELIPSQTVKFAAIAAALGEQGYRLGAYNWLDSLLPRDVGLLEQFAYLFITKAELQQIPEFWLEQCGNFAKAGFVYEHQGETLKKSELERLRFVYVEGEAYPAYPAIADFIAGIERGKMGKGDL